MKKKEDQDQKNPFESRSISLFTTERMEDYAALSLVLIIIILLLVLQ
ncbi:hypothetical protein [Desulforamulus ruminis]|uniref:Uncharacterized protein n=1 Tax=Desulforamulus ruminis (strain ATCC 23193 / DSM 2154 / NCIMB 8452 / DL) TaxID=696281 RepID=F6DVB4_DESRL|nr:hypothetical protein [Desulforamulus ruminis]AEG60267.1 hypothetical protein Desru_2011 [Desulforamulus ruminis DSM 2154]